MNVDRIRKALQKCEEVSMQFSNVAPLPSVRAQLQYLSDVAEGRTDDRSRLKDIILGIQAAREVESLNEEFADVLHEISAEVRALL